ncbi:hypothetical protein CON95_00280 [Bacillus toyonensis]|uniref:PIN domain-containing protein n=1 Tax=Bacillus toyonensis TaxID=155322 RepID=UPI000BEC5F74|nr:hypothetical protein [Bacillus toyonensis]PEE25871.1 hypothetical protein CON95_00280 [Bacillus toyonensis]
MSGFIGRVASSLSIKLITSAIGKQKLKIEEKMKIKNIQVKISDFNRRFDNTELDTYTFQKHIESKEIEDKIYERVFEGKDSKFGTIQDFKIFLAQEAVQNVNNTYKKMKRSKIHNEEIFYEYFSELVEELIDIRNNILSWDSLVQVAIIKDAMQENHDQILQELKKLRQHNIFADDKIEHIKNQIDRYKLDEVEKELSDVLEAQDLLSNSQREEVYYQKARISVLTNKYEQLGPLKDKIHRINSESKYILEIDYELACYQKDERSFSTLIEKFKKHRYSDEQLLLKEIHFHIMSNMFYKAKELLVVEGELRSELKEYHNAYGYLGIIFLQNNDSHKAQQTFNKAFELQSNIIYKYNTLVAQRALLMEEVQKGKEGLESELTEIISELKEIQYITKFFSQKELIEFWVVLVSLLIIKNPKEALIELDYIHAHIKKEKDIQSLFADVYYLNQMYQQAKEILLKIWDYNQNNIIKLLFIYDIERKWESIIEKYNLLKNDEHISNPVIYTLNLKARYKLHGYSNVKQDIIHLIQKERDNSLIIWMECLRIVLENEDEGLFRKVMANIDSAKNYISNIDLFFIAQLLLDFKKNENAREILDDKIESDKQLLELYFNSYRDILGENQETHLAYEKVKLNYSKGIRFNTLMSFKIDIEIIFKNWRKAKESLLEYRNLFGIDTYYAYNMITSSINRKEYGDLEDEINHLLSTQNPDMQLLVAFLKSHQEKWSEAQNLALKALYTSHDKLSKEILMNFLRLFFANTEKTDEVNYNRVKNDSVVFLKNENGIRKVAIHQNKGIIKKAGEVIFDCENYPYDDYRSLILKSEGEIGEKIEFLNEEYEVSNILNLFTYMFRLCLEKVQNDYPNHDNFITYSFSEPEEIINDIEMILKNEERENAKLLEYYDFGVETGVPISYLSGKNITSYAEMLIFLLNHKRQHLFTGEVSIYNNKNDNQYVLSISSLLLLANFGLMGKLKKIMNRCYVSPEVIRCIEVGMQDADKHSKVSSAVLRLNEDGQLSKEIYNEEGKKARRRFWSEIRRELSNFTEVKVDIDELELYNLVSGITLDVDIESIELSRKTDRIFVCDDLFIRKLHHGVTNGNNTTNFIGLLISEKLVTYPELISIVLKLVKAKYLYALNSNIILDYCEWLFSLEKQSDRETYLEKLKDVFYYIYNEDSLPYYAEFHKEIIKGAMKKGIRPIFLYELMKEPLKLKPFNEFIAEQLN